MSEVVVSGYYGFNNAGDEAMLTAMVEALTDVDSNIHITVISGNPQQTRERHGVQAVHRLNVPAIWSALSGCDLLISGGGSLLQDVTSDRSLYYYLSIVLMAQMLHKPVMLYAQGIGPFRRSLAKQAMRHVAQRVNLITVRDEGSAKELRRLGVSRDVLVTADPVLALHPMETESGKRLLAKQGIDKGTHPLIGFAVREWKDWAYYKQTLAKAADMLVDQLAAKIVFLPMQWPEDVEVAHKIARRMRHPATVLTDDYSTNEMLSMVGLLNVLVGIRLHALIFAAVMDVPMVGVSYDPKIDHFLHTIGECAVGTLQTVQPQDIVQAVERCSRVNYHADAACMDRVRQLHDKAFCNAELAVKLMGQFGG